MTNIDSSLPYDPLPNISISGLKRILFHLAFDADKADKGRYNAIRTYKQLIKVKQELYIKQYQFIAGFKWWGKSNGIRR